MKQSLASSTDLVILRECLAFNKAELTEEFEAVCARPKTSPASKSIAAAACLPTELIRANSRLHSISCFACTDQLDALYFFAGLNFSALFFERVTDSHPGGKFFTSHLFELFHFIIAFSKIVLESFLHCVSIIVA